MNKFRVAALVDYPTAGNRCSATFNAAENRPEQYSKLPPSEYKGHQRECW